MILFLLTTKAQANSIESQLLKSSKNSTISAKSFKISNEQNIEIFKIGTGQKKLLIVSGIHGDETAAVGATIYFLKQLLANSKTKTFIRMLQEVQLEVIPVASSYAYMRRTRGTNNSLDINRDFPTDSKPFSSTHEAKFLSQYLKTFRPTAILSIHAGTEAVLWPYGYKKNRPKDHTIFKNLASKIAKTMNINVWGQSFYDYPTKGELIDYAYEQLGIIALTLEISKNKRNTSISNYKRTTKGILEFIKFFISTDIRKQTT